MEKIVLKARAKINLGLDVLRRREDGYHEVKMIMQSIGLYDRLTITKNKENKINISCNRSFLPVNEDNLIYKACMLMKEEYGIDVGVDIELDKRIPVAAGLAGGSSDAAATLIGINKLYELGASEEKLKEIGVKIGADVPFCIMRGTVLACGIGEKLTALPDFKGVPIVIAKPAIGVSTKFVYTNLKLTEETVHPDIDGIIEAISAHDVKGVCNLLGNVLETVTIPEYPIIGDIKSRMMELGAVGSLMSGSGPTVFGIFGDEDTARKCAKVLKEEDMAKQVYVTETFSNSIR